MAQRRRVSSSNPGQDGISACCDQLSLDRVTLFILALLATAALSRPGNVERFSIDDNTTATGDGTDQKRSSVGESAGESAGVKLRFVPAADGTTAAGSPPSPPPPQPGHRVGQAVSEDGAGVDSFERRNVSSAANTPSSAREEAAGTSLTRWSQNARLVVPGEKATVVNHVRVTGSPNTTDSIREAGEDDTIDRYNDDDGIDGFNNNDGYSKSDDVGEEVAEHWIDFTNQSDSCGIRNWPCSPFFASPCDKRMKPGYQGNCNASLRQTIVPEWKSCGLWEGVEQCWCRQNASTCCSNLIGIPEFNTSVLYLNFTGNNLTRMNEEVLQNVTQLRWLIVSLNAIADVSRTAFRRMTSLRRLELSDNRRPGRGSLGIDPVNFTEAVNALNSTLSVLDVNFTHFAPYESNGSKEPGLTYIVRHLRLPLLRQLFLTGGQEVSVFYLSDVYHLPQLCSLAIGSRKLRKIYCCSAKSFNDSLILDVQQDQEVGSEEQSVPTCVSRERVKHPLCRNFSLPSLQVLDLFNNSLVEVPRLCNNIANSSNVSGLTPVLPSLKELSLAVNAIVIPRREQFRCLDGLESLALTGNSLNYLESSLFTQMKSLHSLDMRFTNVMRTEGGVFSHENLTWLSIKSSNWFFDDHHEACCISPDIFKGSRLRQVDLSYNVFVYATKENVEAVLTPLANTVTSLWMAEVGRKFIPDVVGKNFTGLKVLDFKSNLLSSLPHDTFNNMPYLTDLDLSDNHLAVFQDVDLYKGLLQRNVQINLEKNPFACTCEILDFLNLYKANHDPTDGDDNPLAPPARKGMFVGKGYNCYSPEQWYNRTLMEVNLTIHNCLLNLGQEILVIVACLLILFCFLMYIILYRYRWQVRFWLYTIHMRIARGHNLQRRPRARFSAFVSYCREDSKFVLNKVMPALENIRRLQLCIHERDFQPGRYITENVLQYMSESEHILLVLSNAALKNDQCRFELFIAQKIALIERQMPIIVLILEQLDSQLLDMHVFALLHLFPPLRWPGAVERANPELEEVFWASLGRILGAVVAGPGRVRHRRERP